MTQETKRSSSLIEYKAFKPFVDATALGVGSAAFAIVSGNEPLDWALLGAGCSLFWHWGSANLKSNKSKPRRRSGRSITVNSGAESKNIHIFDQAAPGYITRETLPETFFRWTRGKPQERKVAPQISKPPILDEFVFVSDGVELIDSDVRRFLLSAWRNRDRGSGLSNRRWVRDWRSRPQWYQDLGVPWYNAFVGLLREAQQITRRQLVIEMGHQQYGLKYDPHTTRLILKWAEYEKGK